MKRSRVLLLLAPAVVVAALVLSNALAQTGGGPAPTRVAVCDVVSIFGDYEKAQGLMEKLERLRTEIEQKDKDRIAEIEVLQLELENLRPGSGPYEETRNNMERLAIDRKVWLEYQKAVALREHHQKTREIYNEILEKVRQVAEQSGYDLVLFRRQREVLPTDSTAQLLQEIERRKVLYSSPRVDITQVVLDSLNAEYEATGS